MLYNQENNCKIDCENKLAFRIAVRKKMNRINANSWKKSIFKYILLFV